MEEFDVKLDSKNIANDFFASLGKLDLDEELDTRYIFTFIYFIFYVGEAGSSVVHTKDRRTYYLVLRNSGLFVIY